LIWIEESGGKIYITSDYMGTALGRLWKHWAVQAVEGDGMAVVRINGTRYERKLVRITEGPELDGVVAKKRLKYRSDISRELIEAGHIWVFELAPRV
jgi:endonuclease YncB( thermonuclease family)